VRVAGLKLLAAFLDDPKAHPTPPNPTPEAGGPRRRRAPRITRQDAAG
jgi:hypothetical protein